jgi:hypothetical protein
MNADFITIETFNIASSIGSHRKTPCPMGEEESFSQKMNFPGDMTKVLAG